MRESKSPAPRYSDFAGSNCINGRSATFHLLGEKLPDCIYVTKGPSLRAFSRVPSGLSRIFEVIRFDISPDGVSVAVSGRGKKGRRKLLTSNISSEHMITYVITNRDFVASVVEFVSRVHRGPQASRAEGRKQE